MEWLMIPVVIAALLASSDDATLESAQVGLYAGPGGAVSVSFFREELSPYGRWVEVPPYGPAWVPLDVEPTWRPYTVGYWIYSDAGWSWVSYEPYGDIVYHYGRWAYDPVFGWAWVPDTIWSPAWVAWHVSDDWVGWAPLPPGAVWQASRGLRWRGARALPVISWSFVDARTFMERDLRRRLLPPGRTADLLRATRDVTRFDARGGRPFNHGVDTGVAERRAGKPVRIEKVAGPPAHRNRDRDAVGRPRRDRVPASPGLRGAERREVRSASPSRRSGKPASPARSPDGKGKGKPAAPPKGRGGKG